MDGKALEAFCAKIAEAEVRLIKDAGLRVVSVDALAAIMQHEVKNFVFGEDMWRETAAAVRDGLVGEKWAMADLTMHILDRCRKVGAVVAA